jgi:1,4-alpha-glucan branching enzyme
VFSPILCHLLSDASFPPRFLAYLDRRINFCLEELKRTKRIKTFNALAAGYYNRLIEERILFTERYDRDLLKVFLYYQKKDRVELLTSAATNAFLPFYACWPEAIQAQIEVALQSHRNCFGIAPQGFWLPGLGWDPALADYLRAYNTSYTIVDTHALLLGSPPAARGTFYPVRTAAGICALGRDFYACRTIADRRTGFATAPGYRDERKQIDSRYWAKGGPERRYNLHVANDLVEKHARRFLNTLSTRFTQAAHYMRETPISVCALNASLFGRTWHEGPAFIEELFRQGAKQPGIRFMTPAQYLAIQPALSCQTITPEFSSGSFNGYAETWLDASNDWVYRHVTRALERMTELAERFPNNKSLKERALNQAAREVLLAQSADWPAMLYHREQAVCSPIESALRNFTTIYEALGSGHIGTEWLTAAERQHNLFPHINYRVFRKKK